MKKADVVIAGGGIIGLSTALELAQNGLSVIVVDRSRAMSEASWAAAGMLAARDPENPAALRPLAELSLQLYPEYLERLKALTDREVPWRTRQALQGTRLGGSFSTEGAEFGRKLTAVQANGYVGGLVTEAREFLLLEESSLDPRDLCSVLPLATKAAKVTLIEDVAVSGVRGMSGGVEVRTAAGLIAAGEFVNCCGAWAGSFADWDGGLPTKSPARDTMGLGPRKGQIVTVQMPEIGAPPAATLPILGQRERRQGERPSAEQLRVVVRTPETYLVPRGDGRIVVGATVERAGFDKTVDSEVVQTLVNEACALWPALREAAIVETWAGLRPGSGDGLPVMGAVADAGGDPHCWVAAGHFRNGILLAPATARVMRQLLTGAAPDVPVEAFRAERFFTASHASAAESLS